MKPARAALIAALVAATVALPSIRNDFVEDDLWVLRDRHVLVAPPSVKAILTEPYWRAGFGGRLWRPLVLASWAIDYRISHSPHWFHAVNIGWAALAAGLLTLLAIELVGWPAGFIAGLLFAVHPVHVEATSSLVGRAELMVATGYAIALLCALRTKESRWWLAGVVLGSALAIGSKEHAATLPAAALLILVWRGGKWRDAIMPAAAAALPIIAYFMLRGPVAGGALNSGGMAPGLEGLSAVQRTIAMTGVSIQWWRLLAFPLHLSSDWSTAQVPVNTLLTVGLVLTAMLWIAAASIAFHQRRTVPGLALGVLWFLLTIAPVANVAVPTESVLAERTLYLPSLGAMIAAASLIVLLPRQRLVRACLAVLLVALATRSILRNQAWRDVTAARLALIHDAPKSYRTLWLLGDEAFAHGRPGTGERLLHDAMAAAPGIPGPVEDLAGYYSAAGLHPQATALLRKAITLNHSRSKPWMLMENADLAGRDTAAAVRWALRSAELFPRDADVLNQALGTLIVARECVQAGRLLGTRPTVFTPEGGEQARRAIAACRTP